LLADDLFRQRQCRRRRHHAHLQPRTNLPELFCALASAMAAVADDSGGLATPLVVKMINGVFQRRGITPVVLRRHEHHCSRALHFLAPRVSVGLNVFPGMWKSGLVVHGKRPVRQVNHFIGEIGACMPDAGSPMGNTGTGAAGTDAPHDQ